MTSSELSQNILNMLALNSSKLKTVHIEKIIAILEVELRERAEESNE